MGKRESTKLFKWLIIIGMSIASVVSVVMSKLMYQTKSKGIHGDKHYFEKPWFQDWTMFFGMSFCLFGIRKPKTQESKPILASDEKEIVESKPPTPLKRISILVMAPATCDLIASFLSNAALIWLSGSVWQMFRNTVIIFTAFLAVVYRKHKLPKYEWFGVIIVVIGLVIVGVATLKAPEDTSNGSSSVTLRAIGILLVTIGQLVWAFQTIFEEQLLHDINATEWTIVGFEGMWGFLFCIVFMIIAYFLPGKDGNGLHENTLDSFVMLYHSGVLIAFTFTYIAVVFVYNITGVYITSFSSALFRNLIEAIRPFLIWITLLTVHYSSPDSELGEKWTTWGWLELVGFIVTIFGTFVYNKSIKLPFLFYGNEQIKSNNQQKHQILKEENLSDDLEDNNKNKEENEDNN
ncbi:hypothetical protein M0811_07577 [Anaeramoeba ignava]|uniref:EamA domain-containing protein n=1 Tax=Anaeramoeba ignava TaxID=1746090 RepID=A0A9Q0RDZ1_ANAIG|nr:hypothetical protein M0811_07577 [Anaeramoeba ignava]